MKKEEYLKKINKEDFKYKYENSNFITKNLINNFYRNIKEMADKLEIDSILEVACGHGFSTKYLSELFKNKYLEASDHEDYLIKDAKILNPQINISKESIYSLNREYGSFDLVIALEVLEHLDKPEKALAELKRITKKYVLISVPNEPIWRMLNMARGRYIRNFGNTPGHINHWSRKKIIKLISKYFDVQEVKLPLPWIVILAKHKYVNKSV